MSDQLMSEVAKAAQGGNPQAALALMLEGDRSDIRSQAAVRYLRSIGKWSSEEGSQCAKVLEHLFGFYEGRVSLAAETYVAMTSEIVKTIWGYEFPAVVAPLVVPPSHIPPSKKPRGYKRNEDITLAKEAAEEGVSGSRTFKTLRGNGVDTTGASERLKGVIDIQRNG
jgi:hypothetical protein